jgi:hypothetical protein
MKPSMVSEYSHRAVYLPPHRNSTEDRVNSKQRLADFKVALVGVAGALYNRGEILVAMCV